jgi:hypothetical protein
VPTQFDSFYHATRALEALSRGGISEWDPKGWAPLGGTVSWPWLYDHLLFRVAQWSGPDPLATLVRAPQALAVLNGALVGWLGAVSGLSLLGVALLTAGWATLGVTHLLAMPGNLDHHGAEHTFVLAGTALLVRWAQEPAARRRAAALGATLGLALGVQGGLVVLHAPVAAWLLSRWLRGCPPPLSATAAFAGAALVATLAVAGPSEPFLALEYRFEFLSWFHVALCGLAGLGAVLTSTLPRDREGISLLAGYAALAGAALAPGLGAASAFVLSAVPGYEQIGELATISGIGPVGALGAEVVYAHYGRLVWLSPVVGTAAAVMVWRSSSERAALATFALLGSVLLQLQFRLHYFGAIFFVLFPVILLEAWWSRAARGPWASQSPPWRGRSVKIAAGLAAAGVLAWANAPCIAHLSKPAPLGGEGLYAQLQPFYLAAAGACENQGAHTAKIILASPAEGHFLRFHTQCAVVASPMLLSPEDVAAHTRAWRWLSMPVEELQLFSVPVDLVLVHRLVPLPLPMAENSLWHVLLGPEHTLPPGFEVILQAHASDAAGTPIPYVRLVRVVRPTPGPGA